MKCARALRIVLEHAPLNKRPVVVLFNNDGCVASRSREAKDLGIKMGIPVFKVKADFKIKAKIQKYNITVLSSNYALYGDISERYSSILKGFSPYLETYSIDESFLDLSEFLNVESYDHKIRQSVLKNIGLPTCGRMVAY